MKSFSYLIIATSIWGSVQAEYCPRCVKIEAQRAEEQANNPSASIYYEDYADYSSHHSVISNPSN